MPATPLEVVVNIKSDMAPDGYITIESPTPILHIDTTKIHLSARRDTLFDDKPFHLECVKRETEGMEAAKRIFILTPDSTDHLWTMGKQYSLVLDSAAFTDIYGKVSKEIKKGMTIRPEEDFTSITMQVARLEESTYIGQLLDKQDKVVRQAVSTDGNIVFNYVKPGEYYFRVFADNNNNGRWDTGDYAADQQAENVYYYPEKLECKAHWPLVKSWNPSRQKTLKPSEITKQKPDKEKKIRNQNQERARKMGIIYIPPNSYINNPKK